MNRLYLVFLLLPVLLFGDVSGILTGTVKDAENGEFLPGVNITIVDTKIGTTTNIKGEYKIENVPVGVYEVRASLIGYQVACQQNVVIQADSSTIVNFSLHTAVIEGEEIIVEANRPRVQKDMTSSTSFISAGNIYQPPVRPIPWQPYTEEYGEIDENGFQKAIKNPLSTFAADIDYASYTNIRRFLMDDRRPPKDAVRAEECINYFKYNYPQPDDDVPLAIYTEYSSCPWQPEHRLVHIGLQGKDVGIDRKPSNLVFLLDVSGSMSANNKLPLVQRSFRLLVEQLGPEDRVAIVTYAGSAGLALDSTPGDKKEKLINAIDELRAGGRTAGGAGIQLAYKTAKKNFIKDGNNRVILATDGDFNVGVSDTDELVKLIEEKRDDGIFLTVLGFGMGNYKDDKLQNLADKGNGHHAYIDNILEAKRVFVNELSSTLFTIAKDVKIQVEFNPRYILSYRLVGYENRLLEDEDFQDDTKDAGEIGAGHTVTALYEIIPASPEDVKNYELKYQKTILKDNDESMNDVLTIRVRYKKPNELKSREITRVVKNDPILIDETTDSFRFSSAVAMFAMLLRDSEYKGNAAWPSVQELAQSAKGIDSYGYRAEFIRLVERAELLDESHTFQLD